MYKMAIKNFANLVHMHTEIEMSTHTHAKLYMNTLQNRQTLKKFNWTEKLFR